MITCRRQISKDEFDSINENGFSAVMDVLTWEKYYGINNIYHCYEECGTYWLMFERGENCD